MAGDQGQHAAGLQCVHGLGKEEIVQRQPMAAVFEFDVGERHVADHRVDLPFGQAAVVEVFDADVGGGVKQPGDPPGETIELDADEAHALRGQPHEIPRAAAGL